MMEIVSNLRKRKQEKKWTGEETRAFIEMLEVREALWNHKKEVYRNRFEREKCWEDISVATDHSIGDCKLLLNTIKSRYNAEHKKMEQTKSGQSGFTYEPTYEHFEALQFLDAVRNRANGESTQSNLDLSIIELSSDVDYVFEANPSSDSITTPAKRARVQTNEIQSQRTAMLGKLDEFITKKVAEETVPKKWQQCYGEFVGLELASLSEADGRRLRSIINKVIDDFIPQHTIVYRKVFFVK